MTNARYDKEESEELTTQLVQQHRQHKNFAGTAAELAPSSLKMRLPKSLQNNF